MNKVEQMKNEEESKSSNVAFPDGSDVIIALMHEDDLKSAKMNMDEATEENKRLKLTLSQIMKDYQSLKMHFHDLVQHDDDESNKSEDSSIASDEDESALVCRLSLGRFSGETKKEEKKNNQEIKKQELDRRVDGLELGLECKFHLGDSTDVTKNSSSDNSLGYESKEEENNETNASHKSLKRTRTSSEDDEILVQNHLKKPRVSVRAVCDTQTMNDGCQWRKYGQKISKGNPCPRAYYRCTVSSSCPVRKQVQRCAENMSILITTYEGIHNHPLPASATTMASATTSAAAMLNCGSSTSTPSSQEVFSTSSTTSNFNRFSFTSSNALPTPIFHRTSISTSQSHPTVILDLTTPNNTSTPYNKYDSSSLYSSSTLSSSTCLNFSSVPSLNSGSLGSSKNLFQSRNRAASYSQPYINYNNKIQDEFLVDGIDAAAKAITRDPTFQSALAAAITSFVGNGGISSTNVQEKNSGPNAKWGENFNLSFSQPSARNGVTACASSYLNKFLQSLNSQHK